MKIKEVKAPIKSDFRKDFSQIADKYCESKPTPFSGQKMEQKNSIISSTVLPNRKVCTSLPKFLITWLFFVILTEMSFILHCQCCLRYQKAVCVQCPQSMHIYSNDCFDDIPNCEDYKNGTYCSRCKDGSQLSADQLSCKKMDQSINGILFEQNAESSKNKPQRLDDSLQLSKILWHGFQQLRDSIQIFPSQFAKYYVTELLQYLKQQYSNKISMQQIQLLKLYIANAQKTQPSNSNNKTQIIINSTNANKINLSNLGEIKQAENLNDTNYKAILTYQKGVIYMSYKLNLQQSSNSKSRTTNIQTVATDQIVKFSITSEEVIENKENQQFVNVANNTEIEDIVDHFSSYYTQIDGYSPIVVLKGKANSTYSSYRLFFSHNLFGLVQIQITLPEYKPSKYPTVSLNLLSLSPLQKKVILGITQSNRFLPYLNQTQLYKGTKTVKDTQTDYKITFQHKAAPITQNNPIVRPPYSYFVFSVPKDSNGFVKVKDSYLYNLERDKGKYIVSKNVLETVMVSPSTTPIAIKQSFKPVTSPIPNNKDIVVNANTKFFEQLNKSGFCKTPAYQAIKMFTTKYLSLKILTSDLLRVTYSQNETYIIYQMLYKFYRDKQMQYFVFGADKINKQLQLVQNYVIQQKKSTKLTDENRNDVISSFDSNQNFMYTFVFFQQLYDASAQLIQLSMISYVITLNKLSSNGRFYPEQKQVQEYIFKYYYPTQISKPYEFVQFRYALETTTPNMSNPDNRNKTKTSIRKAHGNVIFFREPFIVVETNDSVRRMSVQAYVNWTLLPPLGINDFDIIDVKQSKLRQNIFRVLMVLNKTKIVLYEIDTNNAQQPIQLTSKLVSNTPLTGFTYDTTNSPTNLQSPIIGSKPRLGSSAPHPVPESVSKYPEVALRSYEIDSSKLDPASSDALTALSIPQMKDVLSKLLGIKSQSITNVNLIKRQTLMGLVDTYTVDYTDTTTELSQPHRFVFQIPRNLAKYRASVGFIDPPRAPTPPPESIKPEEKSPLVLVVQNITDLPADLQATARAIIEESKIRTSPQLPQPQYRPPTTPTPTPTSVPAKPTIPPMNQFGTGLVIPDDILNNSTPSPVPVAIKTSSSRSSSSSSSSSSTFSSTSTPNNTSVSNSSSSNSSNSSSQYNLVLQFPYQNIATAVKSSGAVFIPIITNSDSSPALKQSARNLSTKIKAMSNFVSSPARFLPLKFLSSNGYKNFQTLPLSMSRYPNDEVVNYMKQIFDSPNSSVFVQSQRPTKTQPPLSIIASQLIQKQPKKNFIPKTARMKIWSTSPQPNIIQLQFIDKGYTLKTTVVDKDFQTKYPTIAKVQAIVTSQTNMNLFQIGYVDTYLATKNDTVYPSKFATSNNIIYLRQKNMSSDSSNVEIIQINYEFNQLLLRQTLVYITRQGRLGQIHILSMKAYSNELSRLKKQADEYRVQQINRVRQTLEYIEVQKQILKSFTYNIQSAGFDDLQVKDYGDIVLFYIRYPAQGWLFQGRMGYNRTSKKATVYSVNYAGNVDQSIPSQKVTPTMTNNATLNAMLNSFGGIDYSPVLIRGCKLKKKNIRGCIICNDDYYLGKDQICYPRINNCQIQSGVVCLECSGGFLIDANFNCK